MVMNVNLTVKVLKKVRKRYDRLLLILMQAEREIRNDILPDLAKDEVLTDCCEDAISYLRDIIKRIKIYHNDINALTKISPLKESK